jgi:hypothetical protein
MALDLNVTFCFILLLLYFLFARRISKTLHNRQHMLRHSVKKWTIYNVGLWKKMALLLLEGCYERVLFFRPDLLSRRRQQRLAYGLDSTPSISTPRHIILRCTKFMRAYRVHIPESSVPDISSEPTIYAISSSYLNCDNILRIWI